ncbi:MAG TPA: 50S ribosomal protein L18 [Chthoniobacteraceae bacterium]|jgi:large subunit ribosomal protein L18|nr:ribosomal protein [Chthoniobacter sp.]HEV7868810.1 50S ribosomal protein L18 [Chthoniobacteraceae bacterium]
MATKQISPLKLRHQRLRKKVSGTPERPRLAVHFSGKNIYAQVIDDQAGRTIASASTTEKDFRSAGDVGANTKTAVKIGSLVAERSLSKDVTKVVFDRGGFLYHGKVRALADAARESGLEF